MRAARQRTAPRRLCFAHNVSIVSRKHGARPPQRDDQMMLGVDGNLEVVAHDTAASAARPSSGHQDRSAMSAGPVWGASAPRVPLSASRFSSCIWLRSPRRWPLTPRRRFARSGRPSHFGHLPMPKNITRLPLPAMSPELKPVENIWQFMHENWLSNRIFTSYQDILDHRC
jgi:hypothetical protein